MIRKFIAIGSVFFLTTFPAQAQIWNPGSGTSGTLTSITAGLGQSVAAGVCGSGSITTTGTISQCVPETTKTADYVVLNSDGSSVIVMNSAGAHTVTLGTPSASGNFATGWCVNIVNQNTGLVTLTATAASIVGAPTILGQNGFASLCSDGTNYNGQGNGGGVSTVTSIDSNTLSITSGVLTGKYPALSANQLLGSLTAVAPTGQTVPSCSATGSLLNWTSGSGFGCITTVATTGAANAFAGNNTHSGTETFTGSLFVQQRTITAAGAVTVSATTDYILCVNKASGAATTVNLPASPATGAVYIVKDCKGDAATNNITVTPAAGNIDGSGTYVMSTAYQSQGFFYNGTQWYSE